MAGTYPRPTKTRQRTTMSEYGNITASLRTRHGKGAARQLRRSGMVPAVMYGRGGDNLSLALDPHLFAKATDPQRKYNTLFTMTVEQEGAAPQVISCMVADIQTDPIRDHVMHIDFMRVDTEQEVQRKIPVRYEGRAAGVAKGGKLRTFRRMVIVSAKPAELPEELLVEVTPLEPGDYLRVSDMSLANSRFMELPEAPLAYVELPKAAQDDEEAEGDSKGEA